MSEEKMRTEELTVTGKRDALDVFRGYFAGPPRIEAVKIEDSGEGLTVTVEPRDAEIIRYAAEKFGCVAEIE